MKKSTVIGGLAAIAFFIAAIFLFGLDANLRPVPEINVSCEVDADCVDVGGGSCSSGCTWPMNIDSEDAARDWLRSQRSRDEGCYMDCPAYDEPVCDAGECVVPERTY